MTEFDSSEGTGPGRLVQSTVDVAGTSITMQQLQQIHSELTGKSLSLNDYYDTPIQVGLADVERLHHQILQSWEQYNVVSSNASFTIFYFKDSKADYTSFERFQLQAASGSKPVESILIKYNFLIVLPNIGKSQSYTITIRLISQIALQNRLEEDAPFSSIPPFLRTMTNHTGSAEITYVDYSVARAMMAVIQDWFATVPRAAKSRFIKPLQRHSHWIPRLVRLFTVAIVIICLDEALPHLLENKRNTLLGFGEVTLWSSLGIYSAYQFAGWLGRFVEMSIDTWSYISFINFNGADQLEINKYRAKYNRSIGMGVLSFIASLSVSLIAKIIISLISQHLY